MLTHGLLKVTWPRNKHRVRGQAKMTSSWLEYETSWGLTVLSEGGYSFAWFKNSIQLCDSIQEICLSARLAFNAAVTIICSVAVPPAVTPCLQRCITDHLQRCSTACLQCCSTNYFQHCSTACSAQLCFLISDCFPDTGYFNKLSHFRVVLVHISLKGITYLKRKISSTCWADLCKLIDGHRCW